MADVQGSVADFDFHRSTEPVVLKDPFALLLRGPLRKRSKGPVLNLRELVQQQVVPRLHDAHRNDLRRLQSQTILPVVSALESEVTALGDKLMASDHAGACGRIDALRIEGRSLECIYLDLLAPTASYLRHLWSDDLCGFAEATLGLLNLQSVLRAFAPAFRSEDLVPETGHRTMVVSPKHVGIDGSTAMFGLSMVSEFFRRGGWDAWIEPDLSSEAFGEAIRHQWFDVVELLASSDRQLDGIASSIRTIRRGSPNRSVGVIVAGQVFIDHPEFVRLVGADLTASDPRVSLKQANHFVSLPAPQFLPTSKTRLR